MEKYINFPEKLIIGYHKRHDNSNIAFVTYYKNDGSIAKANAFDGWRDKSKEPVIFDNTPVTGLKIIGFVGGDMYSRDRLAWAEIEDPRGFTCQIKTDNLTTMLKTDNYIDQKFQGQYVYGWDGVTLMIININDGIRKQSLNRDNTIQYNPKECIVGDYYKDKNGDEYLFLGRLLCLDYKEITEIKRRYNNDIKDYYPNICLKYVFKKVRCTSEYLRYTTYASGTITNKLVKVDKQFTGDIEKEIKDFYLYDHGTDMVLDKKDILFNKFEIADKYKITDVSQLPDMNTYNHVYYVIIDDETILRSPYRITKEIFAFCHTVTIQHENGKTVLHDIYKDTRQQISKHLHINTLIENGNLYVLPNTTRSFGEGLMLANDKQKINVTAF